MASLSPGRNRGLLVVLGWLVAVAVAVVVGLAAVDALGRGIVEPASQPLSSSEVSDQLAGVGASPVPSAASSATSSPSASPSSSSASGASTAPSAQAAPGGGQAPPVAPPPAPPPPPPAPPAPPAGETKVTSTDGGTVVSRCEAGLATIRSASPAQGFAVEKFDQEPDDSPQVRFESESLRVDIEVRCSGNTPVVEVEMDER